MRIGIDARMYSSTFTGIGRYVLELTNHLLAMDNSPGLAQRGREQAKNPALPGLSDVSFKNNQYVLFMNEPEYRAFHPKMPNVRKVRADIPIYSLAEQTQFPKLLKKAHLDIMHFTHFNAPIFYRRPSIVTIHDLTITFYPGKKRNGFFQRLGYKFVIGSIIRRAKKIIAVSEHTKSDIIRLYGVKPEKIAVIHEGVNPQFRPIKDEHFLQELRTKIDVQKPFLLYTGNWRNHKNLVNLLKAFALLKKNYNLPHLLVITGKEDPWYPEVRQTVKENHLEGLVRFTGIVPDEDLVLLYNAADVYVFPSFYEGFGLPALESFACETPVCASRTASLPEVCGDAAAYFDPHDPENIAKVIAEVCQNESLKKDLIEKGRLRMKLFSWEKMAAETLSVYKGALGVIASDRRERSNP